MNDRNGMHRARKTRKSATALTMAFLFLLSTMIAITTTNTPQTTGNTPMEQDNKPKSPTRDGAPSPTGIYWSKTYGGTGYDEAQSIQQTADGGYIVCGYSESLGAVSGDFWVLKLNSTGGVDWQITYGGANFDYAYSVQQTIDGGYIVAGYTNSFGAGGNDAWVLRLNSTGGIEWQKTYGGANHDYAESVQQTIDGGYIVAGYTYSFGAGQTDVWVLKLNSTGGVDWQKAYGGRDEDKAYSVQQTADEGYIVAGYTYSLGAGYDDFWVLKLRSDGSIVWNKDVSAFTFTHVTTVTPESSIASIESTTATPEDNSATATVTLATPAGTSANVETQGFSSAKGCWAKTYGGADSDEAYSVQQTADEGYIVAGLTSSFSGGIDAWVLRLNSTGGVEWQKTYGGGDADFTKSIGETSDGGYIITGLTYSFGAGQTDFWVLKLNSTGGVDWQKAYGGSSYDEPYYVQETADEGYIVAGRTWSFGAGESDAWVLKLNSTGGVDWNKTYGDTRYDGAFSAQQTADEGYIVAGYTDSFGAVGSDFWVLKLNSTGGVDWQKIYGGDGDDYAESVQQTIDGGYIVAGSTFSFGAGEYDVWVLKLNSTGGVDWQKTYGGSTDDRANSVQQTADGGYIVSGRTDSFGAGDYDFWVLKLNSTGGIDWQKTYGGTGSDEAESVQETADEGYIVVGHTWSFGAGSSDFWVLKLSSNGSMVWNEDLAVSTHVTDVVPADSTVSPDSKDITITNSNAKVEDTSATVADSSATILRIADPDATPPATISDLTTSNPTSSSITLTWTAPGDDGMDGNATGYVVKYSTSGAINSSNWASATPYPQSWEPSKNGTIETHNVTALSEMTRYWFAIEAYDFLHNYGGVSNSPNGTTSAPAPTIDQPSNVSYVVGQTGNTVTWNPSSLIPDHYTISFDGGSPTSHSWNGSAITVNVDGLQVGTHNVTCTVYDTIGRSATSTVTVTVTPQAATPWETIAVLVIVGASLALGLVAVVVHMNRAKSRSITSSKRR